MVNGDLAGRVALVTGASRGIGRAIALQLAAAGADVAVGYGSRREMAEEVAEAIRARGRRAVALGADMAEPHAVRALADRTCSELGTVHVLVANAGVGPRAEIADIDVQAWDQVLDVNLRAPFLLAQALIPQMRRQHYGRIIFISSVAAFQGGILAAHYTASKAGLLGLTRALARPLARQGITVNAVAPALIETEMLADNPAIERGLADQIPVGRLGRPEEVAQLVVAVAANPYLTSQTLSVDGGLYPR